jgi:hypothetical protein
VAARRLVIVMLVLLGASTLAAALLPAPDTRDAATTTTGPQAQQKPSRSQATGLLLAARMQLGRREPKKVRVLSGDELRLMVAAPFGDDIEIPGLGLTQPVTPFAPASFDLLALRRGTYPVRAVDSGLLAGRLLVARPGSRRCGVSRPEAPRERGSTRSCAPHGGPGSEGRGQSGRRP